MIGRQELKYICTSQALAEVEFRLTHLAERDTHADERGTYTISSLYFDDYENSCCRDNEAGVSLRKKYRVRFYGQDLSTLHLEKKIRDRGSGWKQFCTITPAQLDCFFTGQVSDLLYDGVPPLLQELAVLHETRRMVPKTIVRYERTPFACYAGNVRITLDRAICGSADTERFLQGDYAAIPLQPAGQELLEVKFDTILPAQFRNAVWLREMTQTSFSKYYLSRLCVPGKGVY